MTPIVNLVLNLVTRKRSTDQILKPLVKHVAALEKHIESQKRLSIKKRTEIEQLITERSVIGNDIIKAEKVSKKLNELFGV